MSKRNNSLPNQNKRKLHTTFKEKVHRGTGYLKKVIFADQGDSCRFICQACKDEKKRSCSGYCENLRGHLLHKSHQETLKDEEGRKECIASIKFLERGEEASQSQEIQSEEEGNLTCLGRTEPNQDDMLNEVHLKFSITCFLITNNLPFNLGPKLANFFKSTFETYDPSIISQVKLTDHQVNHIAVRHLSSEIKIKNALILESSPFSISIDEGTDKMGKTYIAISARCFSSPSDIEPEDRLLGLIEGGESATGEAIYEKVTNFFNSLINKSKFEENFMGICCDHSSNMISEGEKGLTERLRKDYPYIYTIHDYAHIFNLVLQEAIDQFPNRIIKLISSICNHFTRSSQRKCKLKEIQKLLVLLIHWKF